MELSHLFREHFRTYNIPDSIVSSGEIRTNKYNPCPQLYSLVEKYKVFKNLKMKYALNIMLAGGEKMGVMKIKLFN